MRFRKTIRTLLPTMSAVCGLLPVSRSDARGQAPDTVRLQPANILVTMPRRPSSGVIYWGRSDSTLRDGRPLTFLKPRSWGLMGRPMLWFSWLPQPDCSTWGRHMARIAGASTRADAGARVEEMRAEIREAMAAAGVVESLPPAPARIAIPRDQSPEDFVFGAHPFVVEMADGRPAWARADSWSEVYVVEDQWFMSCFSGARRPLVVVTPIPGTTDRDYAHTRDVLNAVGRAARQQYARADDREGR